MGKIKYPDDMEQGCEHDFKVVAMFVSDLTVGGKPQYDQLMQCTRCKEIGTEPADTDI